MPHEEPSAICASSIHACARKMWAGVAASCPPSPQINPRIVLPTNLQSPPTCLVPASPCASHT